MGEAAKKKDVEEKPKGEVTPFPDATQLALQGVKPDHIKKVEAQFEKVLELKAEKSKTDAALKDAKERLYEVMKDGGVPSYGYKPKSGKTRWIADISEEPKLVVKKAKNDRD